MVAISERMGSNRSPKHHFKKSKKLYKKGKTTKVLISFTFINYF